MKDVLETSESADSETITRIITDELKACGLNLVLVCGFGSDGASVMTGKHNGVGARLQKVCSITVQSHCISHRLALACSDANDTEIHPNQVTLRQLWKWLEYPKRCSVFVALVALMQTLRQFKDDDATAQGLLQRMNNTKFVGTMLLMNAVLPHLNTLSKLFQKDQTCYTSIRPTLESTKSRIAEIHTSLDLVLELQMAFQAGGDCFSGTGAERGWSGPNIPEKPGS